VDERRNYSYHLLNDGVLSMNKHAMNKELASVIDRLSELSGEYTASDRAWFTLGDHSPRTR